MAAFIACGSSDSAPATETATPTASRYVTATPRPTRSPTPTPEPTAPPLSADAPEVQGVLALEGFSDFAREFAAAVEAKDTQFFIDHTHFETAVCPSSGSTATLPALCGGMAPPPSGPGIMLGAWNSEGDVVSEQYYLDHIQEWTQHDGFVYAVGQQDYNLNLGSSEVGIVVEYPGLQPTQIPVLPESVFAYRVDRIDGEWQIVGIDGGTVDLVPYFFKWYARWDDVFPPG
jgi:hypothetical protein